MVVCNTVQEAVIKTIPRKNKCKKAKWLFEKPFLNEQFKEIEENNITGKTRDLFKKTGDIKGTFHARRCTIKSHK